MTSNNNTNSDTTPVPDAMSPAREALAKAQGAKEVWKEAQATAREAREAAAAAAREARKAWKEAAAAAREAREAAQ